MGKQTILPDNQDERRVRRSIEIHPNSMSNLVPGGNRARPVDNREYIAAIKARFPPDRVIMLMEDAIAIAARTNSWRGVMNVVEFAAAYTMGKPKASLVPTGADNLLQLLASMHVPAALLPVDAPADEPDHSVME